MGFQRGGAGAVWGAERVVTTQIVGALLVLLGVALLWTPWVLIAAGVALLVVPEVLEEVRRREHAAVATPEP